MPIMTSPQATVTAAATDGHRAWCNKSQHPLKHGGPCISRFRRVTGTDVEACLMAADPRRGRTSIYIDGDLEGLTLAQAGQLAAILSDLRAKAAAR